MMEVLFKEFAGYISLVIESIGVIVIAVGTVEGAIAVYRVMLRDGTAPQKRAAWMRYARWLVAGLTFQLAGDIVHTAIAPTWDDIGKLATIAVIRTFLTFFLDRDMDEMRALRRAHEDVDQPVARSA